MSFPQKIVLAIDTSREGSFFKELACLDFLHQSEVHLVHVVQEMDYTDGFSFSVPFPLEEDKDRFRTAVTIKLKQMAEDYLPEGLRGPVITQCLFSADPKREFCRYLQESGADLAVVITREHRGLFESSFASSVSRHSPCSVLVLKSEEEK